MPKLWVLFKKPKTVYLKFQCTFYIVHCFYIILCIVFKFGAVHTKAHKSNSNCLSLKQKRAVRIICNAEYRAYTNKLFVKLKIIKFYDLVDMKITIFMFKASRRLLPNNIQNIFNGVENHSHHTRSNKTFKIPRTKLREMPIALKV